MLSQGTQKFIDIANPAARLSTHEHYADYDPIPITQQPEMQKHKQIEKKGDFRGQEC